MLKIISFSIICCLLLVFTGCKKDDLEGPNSEIEITSDFYFDGEINGKRNVFQDEIDHFAINVARSCAIVNGCGCCILNQLTGLSTRKRHFSPAGGVKLQLLQVEFHQTFDNEPTESRIDEMFRVGTYPYNYDNGITITYLDSNGHLWGTDPGDNASSIFEITNMSDDVVSEDESGGRLHKIILAKIECTLHLIEHNSSLPKPEEKILLKNGLLRVRASLH